MSESSSAEDEKPHPHSAALARKKRRIVRNKQRSKDEAPDDVLCVDQTLENNDDPEELSVLLEEKAKPHVTG